MVKFIANYKIDDYENGTIKEVIEFLKSSNKISLDIEATGLDAKRDKIIMIQIGDINNQYIIDSRNIDVSPILSYLESSSLCKIGHGLVYEYKMFLSNYGIRLQNLEDTMLQEMVLKCGIPKISYSLEALSKKYLSKNMDKETRMEFTTIGNKPFLKRHIDYGLDDIINPILIHEKQLKLLIQEDLVRAKDLENSFLRVIGETTFHGMRVDVNKWKDYYVKHSKELEEVKKQLDQYLIDNGANKFLGHYDVFTGKTHININWSSTKQVVPVFKYFGIPVSIIDKDKSEAVSEYFGESYEIYKDTIDSREIIYYKEKYPLVELYLEFSRLSKLVDTYGKSWLEENVKEDGRVYSNFWQVLKTARISSRNPNLQQIPRGDLRSCFIAEEGSCLIVRDYSGQESRILAEYAQEPSMIKEYIEGEGDLHTLTASKIFSLKEGKPVEVTKELRYQAKQVNFGMGYGIGPQKLSKQIQVPLNIAKEILNYYWKSYPALEKYFKYWHKEAENKGYILIDYITKRKTYLKDYNKFLKLRNKKNSGNLTKKEYSEYSRLLGYIQRSAQNYKIQGTAASMTKIAGILMYDWLLENNLFDKVKFILFLHDEIALESCKSVAELVNEKLEYCMLKAGTYFVKQIPMESDGGITDVWDH